jgi:hypothetical protein
MYQTLSDDLELCQNPVLAISRVNVELDATRHTSPFVSSGAISRYADILALEISNLPG